jgi:hypothetical protein
LARRLKENGLDGRTGPAKLLKMRADELADDAGGWPNLSNRESVLVQRTASLILLCETIEHHVFSQQSPFTDSGVLLAVLAKNYIAYSNTVRLNLVALGLKPDKTPKLPSLAEYLQQRVQQTATGNGAGDSQGDAPAAGQLTPSTAARTAPTAATEEQP